MARIRFHLLTLVVAVAIFWGVLGLNLKPQPTSLGNYFGWPVIAYFEGIRKKYLDYDPGDGRPPFISYKYSYWEFWGVVLDVVLMVVLIALAALIFEKLLFKNTASSTPLSNSKPKEK